MVDCEYLDNGKQSRIGKLYAGEAGERLINVAISRARHKLVVVCDPSYIRNIPGNTVVSIYNDKSTTSFIAYTKPRFDKIHNGRAITFVGKHMVCAQSANLYCRVTAEVLLGKFTISQELLF